MTAINRSATKIWVVSADAHPSTLSQNVWSTSNTSGYISGQIKNVSKSGGEVETDSIPVFGGFVDQEKPASQFELEFEIIPSLEATDFEWEKLAYNLDSTTGTATYTSKNVTLADQAVYIQG